jgi:hypothetical protein
MPTLDWKSFLATQKKNAAGNKNTTVFTEAWLPQTSIKQHFQMITADQNLAVFVADSSKKLQVFHSFKNTEGTLLLANNQLMCLFGTTQVIFQSKQTT